MMSEIKNAFELYELVKSARKKTMEALKLCKEIEPDEPRDADHPEELLNSAWFWLYYAEKETAAWVTALTGKDID